MIYYLVYFSSSTHLFSDDELKNILTESRKNNMQQNVTGILLYHEGSILQVLEGEEVTVKNLYDKITKDKRHKNVIQMVKGYNEERSFPEWSMGFKSVLPDEWEVYQGYLSLDASLLYSLIKKKNSRIDTSVNSFVHTSVH